MTKSCHSSCRRVHLLLKKNENLSTTLKKDAVMKLNVKVGLRCMRRKVAHKQCPRTSLLQIVLSSEALLLYKIGKAVLWCEIQLNFKRICRDRALFSFHA